MTKALRSLPAALLLTIAVVLTAATCRGQAASTGSTAEQRLMPRVPSSPTTAALERYVTMPVSEPTGTPAVTIPLLEVRSRQLRLPISLTYHASGVRVTDDASWVGLGWSLQAGGMISRSLRGLPDEQPVAGYLANCRLIREASTITDGPDFDFLKAAAENRMDYQPDVFSYTYPGGSGQFMFGNDGLAHPFPFAPLRIVATLPGAESRIELTASTGEVYQFADWESTVIRQRGPEVAHRSAWYLSRIISADATDTIYFDYRRHRLSYAPTEFQQQILPIYTLVIPGIPISPGPTGVLTSISNVETQAVKLFRIRFATGYVQFNADSTSRLDIPSEARLTSVGLYAQNSPRAPAQLIRQFDLTHSYFQSVGGKQPRMNYRLRLDAVAERNGSMVKPAHRLVYSSISLPPRDSYAQDHWGYYNRRNNLDLIPRRIFSTPYGPKVVGQANREADSAFVQAGLLQQIIYPTGGSTTFRFESNTVGERYQLARPLLSYRADALAESATPKFVFTQFKVPAASDVRARLVMSINCYSDPLNGWPKNTGNASITDISAGNTGQAPLRKIGGCGASSVNLNTGIADSVILKAGHTYRLTAQSDNPDMETEVRVEWEDASQPVQYAYRNVLAGGVRIRTLVTSTTSVGPALTKRYAYALPDHPERSSGYRVGLPLQYALTREIRYGINEPPAIEIVLPYSCTLYPEAGQEVMLSSSALGLTGGSPVAYTTVSVDEGALSGRTVSTYSAAADSGSTDLPQLPPLDNSWRRGQLIAQSVYQSDGSGRETLLEKTTNKYVIDRRNRLIVRGLKVMPRIAVYGSSCGNTAGSVTYYSRHFSYQNFRQPHEWYYLAASLVRRYDPRDSTRFQAIATRYRYQNPAHAQVTDVKVTQIVGDTLHTHYRYPLDYTTTGVLQGTARGITELVERGVQTAVLEQQQWRQKGATAALVTGVLTEYANIRPYRILTVETPAPIASSSFQSSTISNGTFRKDDRYQEQQVVDEYDAWGNIVQQHRPNERPTSYLWAQRGTQLVAEVRNASISEVRQQLQVAGINLATLETDAQLREAMAKLRAKLPKAQVTTYTHAPLIGPTSQTGPDGRTVFYEYDALGRLLRVRDEQRRVLSENEYQYARP